MNVAPADRFAFEWPGVAKAIRKERKQKDQRGTSYWFAAEGQARDDLVAFIEREKAKDQLKKGTDK